MYKQRLSQQAGIGLGIIFAILVAAGISPAAAGSGSYVQSIQDEDITQGLSVEINSPWFATRGDAVVSQVDFDTALDRIPEEHRSGFLISTERIGKMLRNLMLVRLLSHQAQADGMLDDPDLQAKIFQSASVLIAETYRDHYFSEHELDSYQQQARELYLTKPERFKSPETVTFTHILVDSGRERGETDAMRRVLDVYDQLKEGASLDELIADYSDDPAAADNQGRYEEFDPEELEDTVATAVSILEPGQISEPVRSSRGWHIIRLDEKHEPRQLDWEEAQEEATKMARRNHQQKTLETLYGRLLDAPLEVAEGAVDELLDRYGVSAPELPTDQDIQDYEPE